LLTSSLFPCRGGASIRRIGSLRPVIVSQMARLIVLTCRGIWKRPLLAALANSAGVATSFQEREILRLT
jgi:hypothetical protein